MTHEGQAFNDRASTNDRQSERMPSVIQEIDLLSRTSNIIIAEQRNGALSDAWRLPVLVVDSSRDNAFCTNSALMQLYERAFGSNDRHQGARDFGRQERGDYQYTLRSGDTFCNIVRDFAQRTQNRTLSEQELGSVTGHVYRINGISQGLFSNNMVPGRSIRIPGSLGSQ